MTDAMTHQNPTTAAVKLARDALAPCPFCGNRPYLTVRPDNAEATTYFAAVACFCGGYSACAHKMATAPQADEAETLARTAWNRRAAIDALPASVPSGEPCAMPAAPAVAAPEPLTLRVIRDAKQDAMEVFDAEGPETPQIVRDVIEYMTSWFQVYADKRASIARGAE